MGQYRLQLMPKLRMHLGLDDTDSARNGCTTYIAALLVEKLEKLKVKFLDYPNLVRLNPNVPWKTRGNGALCLRFEYDEEIEGEIKEAAVCLLEEQADLNFKGTDPGIVFLKKPQIPQEIKDFARNAITGIVTLKEAINLIKKFEGEALGYNTCRGIIGALAAIGENLEGDHTYELIAYRTRENRGAKRKVIITPRGPDPILLGIRGEKPEIVRKAFAIVKPLEPVERWVIFRTNQGTDAHFTKVPALSEIKPYSSVIAKAVVSRNPRLIPLRHVVFSVRDDGAEVDCAAYEPTDALRKVARKLIVGDLVEVYGAVRRPSEGKALTINL